MNTFNHFAKTGLALGVAALAVSNASAALFTVGPLTAVFPSVESTVPFSGTMSIPKFNAALGTLTSISFTLNGNLTATQKFENGDDVSSTITVTTTGTMTLQRPDTTTLVITIPTVQNTATVGPFDGNINFAGTSGITFSPKVGTLSNTQVYSGASDLALFTGSGNITLPVLATGSSGGTGAANVTIQASLTGQASASVTYTYSVATVPEPSTYGAIGAVSVVGFLGYRRARRKVAPIA